MTQMYARRVLNRVVDDLRTKILMDSISPEEKILLQQLNQTLDSDRSPNYVQVSLAEGSLEILQEALGRLGLSPLG